jgi:predicted RecB family nuclease
VSLYEDGNFLVTSAPLDRSVGKRNAFTMSMTSISAATGILSNALKLLDSVREQAKRSPDTRPCGPLIARKRKAFETFIANVMDRWPHDPGMHIYHYAPYEPTARKRLAGRHRTCVDELDELLRAEIFVDLFRVVRQGLRAS